MTHEDALERLKAQCPHLFGNPDPVAAMADLDKMIAKAGATMAALNRLKLSYSAKARWQRQRAAELDRATTGIAEDGNRIVDPNLLSPAMQKRLLGQ
jgi:hypothetical protein